MGYESVKNYRKRLKAWSAECSGGKCRICGYDKLLSALEFHHVIPSSKSFTLSSNTNKAHLAYKEEALKCVLLCANCHREVEAGITDCSDIEPIWEDLPFLMKDINPPKGRSPRPNKSGIRKSTEGFFKVNWNEIDLPSIWGTKPVVHIARDLGVSDNAVRKRARKLGLIT